MNDDLIRRDDAIDELMHIIPYTRYYNGEFVLLLNKRECLKAIKAVPSADKPQGEWEDIPYSFAGGYRCSICGQKSLENDWNYCPNCGADMRGVDDVE